jgi:hypothetical protein
MSARTSAQSPQAGRPGPALVRLWIGVLLAPVGWLSDFMVRYLVIRYANIHDRRWPMLVCTAGGLALVLTGAWLCWRARAAAAEAMETEGYAPAASDQHVAHIARWGLALAAYFLVLILAQATPTLVLSPSEIT